MDRETGVMDVRKARRALLATTRFYLRPLRRVLSGRGRPAGTWPVRLGGLYVAGRELVLRSPRMSDAAEWCAIRLAEQERIEPWWVTSPLTWEERHTEAAWVSSLLVARRAARVGRALPLVVEVDGRLAGQCGLEWIDQFTGAAEFGIWLDSRVAGHGLGIAATAILADYAFDVLGLQRLTGPVCTDNEIAARTMRRAGLVWEGTMISFLDVGGRRRDHDLWAITADRAPRGGLVRHLGEKGPEHG